MERSTEGTRRERWIRLIDANLGWMFGHQGEDGSESGNPVNFRGTGQLAHSALWAFQEPGSRFYQDQEAFERAVKAMDCLARQDGWKHCPFTPSYVGETLLLLESVDAAKELPTERWKDALRSVLGFVRQTGNHTFGHFSDWDVLYSLSLAIGGRLLSDASMTEAAAEHARLVWASVVPGGEGFYYLISPYQLWPPSVNYTGISTATFARYWEVSADASALEMVQAVKDYFLYYTEPSGLTEFTVSPWHKHTVDTKHDTFAFVAASVEFLARVSEDRRLNQVAELMLGTLESMVKPTGEFRNKPWEPALTNVTGGFDPNTTGYLVYAAGWCKDGDSEPLPDGYVSERPGINAFRARSGDFGYSVVCGESYVSLCGAWVGRDSILQEVAALVADGDGLVFGQMAPLWRKQMTCFPEGFVQTAYYQPAEIIGDSWRARYSKWRVYQTYLGTGDELVGLISLESLADQEGLYAALDFHLGPAGQRVSFGDGSRNGLGGGVATATPGLRGQAFVSPDNSEPLLLSELEGDSWVQYGRLGIFLKSVSGRGMKAALWDGVAKSRMFHDAGEGAGDGLSSPISNDLVISCSTPTGSQSFPAGTRYHVIFVAAPVEDEVEDERQGLCMAAGGRYTVLPTGLDHTFAVAIHRGDSILIVLVSHQPMVRPVLLKHTVPPGSYRVRVFAEERGLVIKDFAFMGTDFEVEIATASPASVVELVRR
ncbi:MAG: hypothetical protein HYY08_02790 [Firmicutes bacterium]|nr:hypothetical protein [Bacillota bacterium]